MKVLGTDAFKLNFKKTIRPQEAYWDTEGMLGKFDPNQFHKLEQRSPNELSTGYIDGGDTLFHLGHLYSGINILEDLKYHTHGIYLPTTQEQAYKRLLRPWGLFARHTNIKSWYGDKHRGSRDNTKGMFHAESFNKKSTWRILNFFLRHLLFRGLLFDAKTKKNGSMENKFPTLTGPTVWAAYIRYAISRTKLFYILYPLLCFLDIEILINAIVKQTKDKKDSDVMNHINYSVWFARVAPTPLIWIMNKYINSKKHFIDMMYKYYDNGREPWIITQIWEPIIHEYFKKP